MEPRIRHQDPSDHPVPGLDPQERVLAVRLKPRDGGYVVFEELVVEGDPVTPETPLEEAEYVALDVETTGNRPFLILEIGAERFRLDGPLSFYDTLVDCRAPINRYAQQRHQIDRAMLTGAPAFGEARSAFLRFARHAVLVEHSHDAFDTYLVGRGLKRPLEHPIIDTSAMARLVLDLPPGQTPGLARVVEELGIDASPAHAALGDAQATAAVFRALVRRGQERFGWRLLGDVLQALPRPAIDRSRIEPGTGRKERPARRPPIAGAGAEGAGEAGSEPARRRRGRSRRRRPGVGAASEAPPPERAEG